MSKVLEASCVAGVVRVQGFVIDNAIILSGGTGSSEGVLIVDEAAAYYVTANTSDLTATLEQVITALNQTVICLTSFDTRGFLISADAGVPSPPAVAANISQVSAAATQLGLIKEALK